MCRGTHFLLAPRWNKPSTRQVTLRPSNDRNANLQRRQDDCHDWLMEYSQQDIVVDPELGS